MPPVRTMPSQSNGFRITPSSAAVAHFVVLRPARENPLAQRLFSGAPLCRSPRHLGVTWQSLRLAMESTRSDGNPMVHVFRAVGVVSHRSRLVGECARASRRISPTLRRRPRMEPSSHADHGCIVGYLRVRGHVSSTPPMTAGSHAVSIST